MRFIAVLVCVLWAGLPAQAQHHKAGEFDYYVMALSWSPNWCAIEGRAKGSPQCAKTATYGWILHGLWPQYHRGWPEHCTTAERNPPRWMTEDMVDIMGSSGLAWYQWKKHGRCSGLSGEDYYALSRQAYDSVVRPPLFRKLDQPVRLPAHIIEEAFLEANPQLEKDMLTITCRDGYIQEARVCMAKDLTPVPCGRDVIRDCTMKNAIFEPFN